MAEREPIVINEKRSWRNSPKLQKFLYYANFPRGRYVTFVLGGSVLYFTAYTVGMYVWKGPDHPINNFNWWRMKEQGLLNSELAEKERLLLLFDQDQAARATETYFPTTDYNSKMAITRIRL